MAVNDINIGDTFGRWTVISGKVRESSKHPYKLLCRCSCLSEKLVRPEKLRNGSSKSCGCLRDQRLTTHGMTSTSVRKDSHEYWIWNMVVQRCTNPNVGNWKDYGGRGITVCAEWLTYDGFYADMGARPSLGHSLERIDNSQGYSKSNCKWATRLEQAKNKRNNRLITAFGKTQHLAEWSRETGIQHPTILYRLRSGWSAEDALSRPVQ